MSMETPLLDKLMEECAKIWPVEDKDVLPYFEHCGIPTDESHARAFQLGLVLASVCEVTHERKNREREQNEAG